jgi:hypothetical protein
VRAGCNSTTSAATAADEITIRDNGDRTARYTALVAGVLMMGNLNLSSPDTFLYKKPCTFIQGTVNVVMRAIRVSYQPPQIDVWLAKLGLSQAQVISNALTIHVDHTPNPVPFPLAPPFLTSLRQVGALVVQECQSCFGGNPNTGPIGPSALFALPGLFALTKFWNFASPQGQVSSLIVSGTALPNFRGTTSGLQCSPGLIKIFNNRRLASLDGLENLFTTLRPGPTVQVDGNPLFVSPASVNALRGLAACPVPGQLSPLSSAILITTAQCTMTVGAPPPLHHFPNARCTRARCKFICTPCNHPVVRSLNVQT